MRNVLETIDVQATLTSLVVLAGGVGAAWAGIRAGIKKVRAESSDAGARITGGVIMDNLSMTMLSDRLRECAEMMRANTDAQRETAHQMERLRDKL